MLKWPLVYSSVSGTATTTCMTRTARPPFYSVYAKVALGYFSLFLMGGIVHHQPVVFEEAEQSSGVGE